MAKGTFARTEKGGARKPSFEPLGAADLARMIMSRANVAVADSQAVR